MLEEYVGTTRPVVREREGLGSSATKCMVEDTKYMQLVRMLRSWMMSSMLGYIDYFERFDSMSMVYYSSEMSGQP